MNKGPCGWTDHVCKSAEFVEKFQKKTEGKGEGKVIHKGGGVEEEKPEGVKSCEEDGYGVIDKGGGIYSQSIESEEFIKKNS